MSVVWRCLKVFLFRRSFPLLFVAAVLYCLHRDLLAYQLTCFQWYVTSWPAGVLCSFPVPRYPPAMRNVTSTWVEDLVTADLHCRSWFMFVHRHPSQTWRHRMYVCLYALTELLLLKVTFFTTVIIIIREFQLQYSVVMQSPSSAVLRMSHLCSNHSY